MTEFLIPCDVSTWLLGHTEHGQADGFVTGFSHPWSGWDHIAAMLAVGIWGAQLGRPAIWVLPVAFPLVMSLGAFLGLIGIPLPGVELGIAASALAMGLFIVTEWKAPVPVALVLVSLFAVFHGHAHGTELPEGQDGITYSIGFVIGTGCLHGVGILVGLLDRWKSGEIFMRLVGAAIAFGGVFFLAEALA